MTRSVAVLKKDNGHQSQAHVTFSSKYITVSALIEEQDPLFANQDKHNSFINRALIGVIYYVKLKCNILPEEIHEYSL